MFLPLLLSLFVVSLVDALEFPIGWELLAVQNDYDVVKFPDGSHPAGGFVYSSFSGKVKSTGRDYTIYIGTISKGLPDTFGFKLPKDGERIPRCASRRLHAVGPSSIIMLGYYYFHLNERIRDEKEKYDSGLHFSVGGLYSSCCCYLHEKKRSCSA